MEAKVEKYPPDAGGSILDEIQRKVGSAFDHMIRMMGADAGLLSAWNGDINSHDERLVTSVGIGLDYLEDYCHHRRALAAGLLGLGQPAVMQGDLRVCVIDTADDERTGEFAARWLLPQGFAHALLLQYRASSGGRSTVLALRKAGEPAFSEAEIELSCQLMPITADVVEMTEAASQLARIKELSQAALNRFGYGVIFLAADGSLLGANSVGKAMLTEHDGLQAGATGLYASAQSDTMRLRAALAQGPSALNPFPRYLSVSRPSGRSDLQLAVSPVSPEAAAADGRCDLTVIVADPEEPPALNLVALTELMGLTNAEARLLAGLAEGRPLQDQADELGIKISTARTYIARMFSKTETRRQPELISLALRSLANLQVD